MKNERSLVIGSNGQIGSELVEKLAETCGVDNVLASDIVAPRKTPGVAFFQLDVMDQKGLGEFIDKHRIDVVWNLAASLSATGEKDPRRAWMLNMDGLLNVLELARQGRIAKVFWPSSIAVFGPTSPRSPAPQSCIMEPNTLYGITKLAGERLCEYYFQKFGVDVRSLRFPGVISYKTPPGGGTTDYAVDIFQSAKRGETYRCFLKADAVLPMMYMPDAIRASLMLIGAEKSKIGIRSSYNLAAFSFGPAQLAESIRRISPSFMINYQPDFRQAIAESWPQTIDDSCARSDWGWSPEFTLEQMVVDMLEYMPTQW